MSKAFLLPLIVKHISVPCNISDSAYSYCIHVASDFVLLFARSFLFNSSLISGNFFSSCTSINFCQRLRIPNENQQKVLRSRHNYMYLPSKPNTNC